MLQITERINTMASPRIALIVDMILSYIRLINQGVLGVRESIKMNFNYRRSQSEKFPLFTNNQLVSQESDCLVIYGDTFCTRWTI